MMIIRIGIWVSMTVICLPKKTIRFVIVSSTAKSSISRHVSAIWQAKISLYSFTWKDKKQQIVYTSAAYWQAKQIKCCVRTERQSPFLLVGLDEKSRCRQLSIKKQNYLSLTICHSDLTSHSKRMLRDRYAESSMLAQSVAGDTRQISDSEPPYLFTKRDYSTVTPRPIPLEFQVLFVCCYTTCACGRGLQHAWSRRQMHTKLRLENLKRRHSRRFSSVTHSHVVLLLLQHCELVLVDTCHLEF